MKSLFRITPKIIATIDLGSNSFHMIVAETRQGQLIILDRLRESIRLGAGLDKKKNLTEDAQQRALECLERFGQRVRNLPKGAVRAVGTNALRIARNSQTFLQKAQQVLGHPIDVVAGREEARLIFLGVAHGLEAGEENRLVVDIGGGSTEIITGKGFEIYDRESLHVGCVGLSHEFFADGKIKKKRLKAAELEAELHIQPVTYLFKDFQRERIIGCSGTIRAIATICQESNWCEQTLTKTALNKLRDYLYSISSIDDLNLPGLTEDRQPIIVGGIIVLWAVFELLDIEQMDVSDQALREGALYDLVGRITHSDVRDRTVDSVCKRWSIDTDHAREVEDTAVEFFEKVFSGWDLDSETDLDMLKWAARLHELGLSISHGQYHKHGAYIVSNADLAGFSKNEQQVLSALIRGHRRKFPVEEFSLLPVQNSNSTLKLVILLRLAVLLHRSRENILPKIYKLKAKDKRVRLSIPQDWIDSHPLAWLDLQQEQEYLGQTGVQLKLETLSMSQSI